MTFSKRTFSIHKWRWVMYIQFFSTYPEKRAKIGSPLPEMVESGRVIKTGSGWFIPVGIVELGWNLASLSTSVK